MMFRVHNVDAAWQAVKVLDGLGVTSSAESSDSSGLWNRMTS
jgi:hypothetical protein